MISSPHFSDAELCCKHCGKNGCRPELLTALEALRAILSRPITINAAYRCPVHNKAVGGVRDSQHLLGLAADISVPGLTATQLETAARQIPAIHGIGRDDYQHYLHLDLRPKPAHWCYGTDGKQVPYYPSARS